MQDTGNSAEIAEPEENSTTVLAEVLPGIAVVFGDVPPELKLDLLDFGLVPAADQERLSTVLGSIGNTATVAGNLGNAFASAQGLYRVTDATMAVLKAGGTLAVKDGANLGAIFANGRIVAQARFIPVSAVGAAQTLAMIGPALAMVALQMQLSEISGLTRTNIALTSQVLASVRKGQWAQLTAVVATIDRAVDQAREVGSVSASLWDSLAGSEATLRTQRDLYRLNVDDHIGQVHRLERRARREYLETNAEAIVFDAHALLSAVKAWTGYQALHAARARAAGPDDEAEAKTVDFIARTTAKELESALAETTSLVDALTRELRIIAELPGRENAIALPGMRRDANAARQTSARLLEAIKPLADALHPPVPALEAPDVLCAPASIDCGTSLRILRWFLEDGETLRVLGFPDQLDDSSSISSLVSGARGMLGSKDVMATRDLVVVTDRRIITAKASTFLEQAEIRQDIPIDQVRYVRSGAPRNKDERFTIDLVTRDENIRWLFPADVDSTEVHSLAAVLAESMRIPEAERDELLQHHRTPIEARTSASSTVPQEH